MEPNPNMAYVKQKEHESDKLEESWKQELSGMSRLWQTLEVPGKPSSPTRALIQTSRLNLRPRPVNSVTGEIMHRTETPRRITWFGMTDRGMIRERNEDGFSILDLGEKTLFMVADGMGGHDAGDVASRVALETVCKMVREIEIQDQNDDLLKFVELAVQQANTAVQEEATLRGCDMGTTLSMAFVADDVAYIASVGDSRVYWIENGTVTQITQDHSLVAKLVEAGKLAKDEARGHPKANVLYRAIGNTGAVTVDTFRIPLQEGGTLMLCSDGLWGEVTDEDIQRICTQEEEARAASSRLVQMANENGGKDNITIVVVKVS